VHVVASGPAGPRRRLGAELRRLRNGAGLHLDQVAGQLHCSTSKISRLETGKGIPKPADVRELIKIYGVAAEGERDMLMRLVRESRTEGWWEPYTDGVQPERFVLDVQARYTSFETEASAIRSYDPAILHGLLQAPSYSRAVMELLLPNHSAQEIEQLVELRGRRQEALTRRRPPLELLIVLDEAVLRRPVGSPEVMADQLRALLTRASSTRCPCTSCLSRRVCTGCRSDGSTSWSSRTRPCPTSSTSRATRGRPTWRTGPMWTCIKTSWPTQSIMRLTPTLPAP
jgi:transcriptional regulator with XRE-family HTH domain